MPHRIVKNHPWMLYVMFLLSLGVFIVGALGLKASLNSERSNRQEICRAVDNIDRIIQAQLQRSLTNLPRITYYKHHPDELRTQLGQVRQEIVAFRPQRCK